MNTPLMHTGSAGDGKAAVRGARVLVVDDIEAARARAVEAGATAEAPVSVAAWGKLALLADPFGHGFCLIQFLGRGYGELEGAD